MSGPKEEKDDAVVLSMGDVTFVLFKNANGEVVALPVDEDDEDDMPFGIQMPQ
jgi:hypothetical protein